MACDMESYEELAEAGWNQDEIDQLAAEVRLARARANVTAADLGLTRTQQQELERRAELDARQVAHDRMHRKLAALLDAMNGGAAKKLHHAHVHPDAKGHISADDRERLRKLGFN